LTSHTVDHKRFVELLIHILCHVIHADEHVDQREIVTIRNYFQSQLGFSETQMNWVQDVIDAGLKRPSSVDALCEEFNTQFDFSSRLLLTQLLYQVALADGTLHRDEDALISTITRKLGLSESDHEQIRAIFVSKTTDRSHYFEVLGLTSSADAATIKKAYRDASKKYHPDRVTHLGDEFREMAEEKMRKINEAYRVLTKG